MRSVLVVLVAAALAVTLVPAGLVATPPPPPDLGAPAVPVTILRDAFGKPHLFAPAAATSENLYALFYANGYAQAQERLFQMEALRHVGRGDAASILGAAFLGSDLSVRRELYTDAEKLDQLASMSPEGRLTLQAFVDGVNRYIAEARANPGAMPVEPFALGHAVEDFTMTDEIGIINFLIFFFGDGGGGELSNLRLLAQLRSTLAGDDAAWDAFHDLVPMREGDRATSIDRDDLLFAPVLESPLDAFAQLPARQREMLALADRIEGFGGADPFELPTAGLGPFHHLFGSNAVLVDAAHSESGHPLLWGAPQMGYFYPNIPYEVALHGAGYDAGGIGVTGTPGIVIGRTPAFAWTVTSGQSDQSDLVAEPVVDWDARRYLHDGQEETLDCRTETHLVASVPTAEAPRLFSQEVCRSVHGPIVATALRDDGTGFAYARASSQRMEDLRSAEMWLNQARAATLADFDANLADFAFTFNFFYADADHIAYRHVGYQPVRDAAYDHRLPMPGDGDREWQGFAKGPQLPRVTDPSPGWLANWNNLPALGWSSGDDREHWGRGHRVEHLQGAIEDALDASHGTLSLDELQAVHRVSATRDPFARHVVPALLDALEGAVGRKAEARAALAAWAQSDYCWCDADGDGRYDHPGHAIWDEWRTRLQDRVFHDELGDHDRPMDFNPDDDGLGGDPHGADHATGSHKEAPLLHALAGTAAHAWFDNVTTPAVETPALVMLDAMDRAVDNLKNRFGNDNLDAWLLPVHHNVYTSLTAFGDLQHPMINRGTYVQFVDLGTGRAENSLAPGTWGLVDALAAPLGVAAPAALDLYNPHFRDQFDLYANLRYKPFWFTEPEVRAHLDDTVTLGGARGESTLVVPEPPALP